MIEAARPSDLAAVLALLARVALPQERVTSALGMMVVAREAGQVRGCVVLEVYGTVALLCSVAVDPDYRARGLGQQLVEDRLQEARRRGVQEVYLITETAQDYFPRFGFRPVERSAVAPALHASVEWTSICPVSAQAMVLQIELAASFWQQIRLSFQNQRIAERNEQWLPSQSKHGKHFTHRVAVFTNKMPGCLKGEISSQQPGVLIRRNLIVCSLKREATEETLSGLHEQAVMARLSIYQNRPEPKLLQQHPPKKPP